MTRSKALAVLLILSVALAGGLQALSLVPHVHGHDVDHSAHSTCPVHQVQNHSIQIVQADAPAVSAPAAPTGALLPFLTDSVRPTFHLQEFLRAPPASF